MRTFFDTENQSTITINDLREVYDSDPTLQEEYESFGHYLAATQTYNGGVLIEVK